MTHRCLALYVAKGFAGEHYDNSAQSLTVGLGGNVKNGFT